jgi:thiol-disulfide isomerase/thioredoxin
MIRAAFIGSLLFIAGCATSERVQEMEDRLAELEATVEKLEAAPPAARTAAAATPEVDTAKEEAAVNIYKEITALLQANKVDEAKAKLAQMEREYSETRAWRRARKTAQELAVVGKTAPPSMNIEQWFQGEGEVNISSSQPTLLVFWEKWCPHCRREVPKLQVMYDQFKPQGLQVIGLTKLSRDTAPEDISSFIEEQNVSYPVAKEDGSISEYFNVSGVPAAAVVKDGQIVWRGHPARLTDSMIEDWL